jgi:hypothetical protein
VSEKQVFPHMKDVSTFAQFQSIQNLDQSQLPKYQSTEVNLLNFDKSYFVASSELHQLTFQLFIT